jgi:hypothetical protein
MGRRHLGVHLGEISSVAHHFIYNLWRLCMKRIETATAQVDKFGAGKPGFTDGNPEDGTPATDLNALMWDQVQESLVRTIEKAGMALSDTDLDQFTNAVIALIEARVGDYSLDTGIVNAYVVAENPPIAAYVNGMQGTFRVAHACTGASTLNAGAGTRPLNNDVGGALQPGDLPVGTLVGWEYDGPSNTFLINSLVASQALTTVTTASDPTYVDNSIKPASTGWIRGAMSSIATAAGFACNLAGNGYIKFPSWLGGLIIQWGIATTSSGGNITALLPIAFPSSAFIATTCSFGGSGLTLATVAGLSTTAVTIYTYTSSTGATVAAQTAWFAIGK